MNENERFHSHDAWMAMLLLGVTLIALAPMLVAPANMAPGLPDHDARTQWYPWRAYAFENIRHGELPLWNPHILCGTPFLGGFQSAMLYPPNLVFALLPMAKAAKFSLALHLWLAMLFTYALARFWCRNRLACLSAGIAFGLCAAQILRVPAGHWGVSTAIPWLPLILLSTEWLMRKPNAPALGLGALAVGMQVLSGMPQYVFISAIAAVLFALMRGFGEGFSWPDRLRRWLAVSGIFLLGALLAAPQLLPGIEAARYGARSLPMRPEWSRLFALGPENLITLLLPNFFGGVEGGVYWGRFFYWEMNIYSGVAALLLAVVALFLARPRRNAVRWGILAIVLLLLALGRHTPLNTLIELLPVAGMFRGAAKFVLPMSLAISVLAGIGFERALETQRRGLVALLAGIMAVLAGAGLLIAFGYGGEMIAALTKTGETFANTTEALDVHISAVISLIHVAAILLGIAGAVLVFRKQPRVCAWMLALLFAFDGIFFAGHYVKRETMFAVTGGAWPEGAVEKIHETDGRSRVLTVGIPELNDAMLARAYAIQGIEPNPPARFHTLFLMGQGRPTDIAPSVYQLTTPGPFIRNLAFGAALYPVATGFVSEEATTLWENEEWRLAALPNESQRALIVHSASLAPTPDDALLMTLNGEPATTVILEDSALAPADHPGEPPKPVQITEDHPDEVVLEAELDRPGFLVLLDNWFPGWKAEVDGKQAKILRADYAFRAVALDAGRHTVTFRYRPATFYGGLGLAFVTLAGLVTAMIRYRSAPAREPDLSAPSDQAS